jgi:hypothetical protein
MMMMMMMMMRRRRRRMRSADDETSRLGTNIKDLWMMQQLLQPMN